MKKKKTIIIICIAIAVILLAGIAIYMVTNTKGVSKIGKLYDNITEKQTYTFTAQNNNQYKYSIAKKNGQTSIDMYLGDDHTTTLVKNGSTYLLQHNAKEYYVYGDTNTESNLLEDQLAILKDSKAIKGKEKIDGKSYRYEEYDGYSFFMVGTNKDLDESKIKTRFYFDGDNLVYIKTIIDNEEEILQTSFTYEADDQLFVIPSNYAENDI